MSTGAKPTRKERRDQRREEDRLRRESEAKRRKTTRLLTFGGIALLVVLGAALAGPAIVSSVTSQAAQGTQYPEQGKQHIAVGEAHEPYNSNPPTSGPHYSNWARWGVHDTPQPDEVLVHNLEHGGIIIQYNCADGCPDLVTRLKEFVGQNGPKVILAPRTDPNVPCRITVTSWMYLDCLQDLDPGRIQAFIKAHRSKPPAPEPFVDS